MEITPVITHHFVKNEDLNHHGTLFAGRTAEWFVEAGLMAAAQYLPADNIVCVKIHGMDFERPVHLGAVVKFTSKAVLAGRTSLVAHIRLEEGGARVLEGFITFVNVGPDGRPVPHGLALEPACEADAALARRAAALPRR